MQNYTDRIQISGCQGLAVERYLTAKRHARTCWNNENVFCLDFGNRYSIVCIWYNSENSNASFIWIKMTEKKKKTHSLAYLKFILWGSNDTVKFSWSWHMLILKAFSKAWEFQWCFKILYRPIRYQDPQAWLVWLVKASVSYLKLVTTHC